MWAPCNNSVIIEKLVHFLVNSSRLYVLSLKFISRITLTFSFNLTSHAKYIVLCGVSHLVINSIWGITGIWYFISPITLVVDSNLLCHTVSFLLSLFKFWQLGSALVMQRITPGSRLNAFGVFHRFSNPLSPSKSSTTLVDICLIFAIWQCKQTQRMLEAIIQQDVSWHLLTSCCNRAGRGIVISVDGVFGFPCWRGGGGVSMETAPSVAIQQVFTIINMWDMALGSFT